MKRSAESLFNIVEQMGGPRAPEYDEDRLARIDSINHPENYHKRTRRQKIILTVGAVALTVGLGAGAVLGLERLATPAKQTHREVECHTVDLTPPMAPNDSQSPAEAYIDSQRERQSEQLNPASRIDCQPAPTTVPR